MNTVLTIAGSDSSGGAGIQADIKTITCNGAYAMSAVTALTAQNTMGVKSILPSTAEFLSDQLDCVFEDIFPDAVKIGMVGSSDLIKVISQKLKQYNAKNVVVDPVMVATSGSSLIRNDAVNVLADSLFPLAVLVTPNIPEAQVLAEMKIESDEDMVIAAKKISSRYKTSVLVKGGHAVNTASDVLFFEGKYLWYVGERINNPNTHGTGCTLSSAIATYLAKGESLECAIQSAKDYLTCALTADLNLGKGSGPLMHNFML